MNLPASYIFHAGVPAGQEPLPAFHLHGKNPCEPPEEPVRSPSRNPPTASISNRNGKWKPFNNNHKETDGGARRECVPKKIGATRRNVKRGNKRMLPASCKKSNRKLSVTNSGKTEGTRFSPTDDAGCCPYRGVPVRTSAFSISTSQLSCPCFCLQNAL